MLNLPCRKLLHLAVGAAALPAVPRLAWAQAYPSRPVRIVVGFASGSAFDILARLIGQALSNRFGQPFVIENRGGAGGIVATEAVARAILAHPEMKAQLAELGNLPTPITVAGFGQVLGEETEKWAKVIRTANIKPE
jgi:tripartite-type tricarboxylate transporter receptor subunit TctC